MKITEILIEDVATVEIKELFNLLKKLGIKYIKSASELQGSIQFKAAFYNIAKPKSIWRGKQGAPEGEFLYIGLGDPMNTYEFSDEDLKKVNLTIEKFSELLIKAKFKMKKTLRKTYG